MAMDAARPGQIVILNGVPRSGKSSIAGAVQEHFDGIWINLGVDLAARTMPERYLPGIGLRPGGERPDLETAIPALYAALYESIAAHSRLGFNVAVDVGHHDAYSRPLAILPACARRLQGLPVLFVGVRCPVETIMARRRTPATGREGLYLAAGAGEPIPEAIERWQRAVHEPGIYDMEVDTSRMSPAECAEAIRRKLGENPARPTAFERLARLTWIGEPER